VEGREVQWGAKGAGVYEVTINRGEAGGGAVKQCQHRSDAVVG